MSGTSAESNGPPSNILTQRVCRSTKVLIRCGARAQAETMQCAQSQLVGSVVSVSVSQSAGASWALSQALLKHQRRAAVSFGLFAYSKTRARMSDHLELEKSSGW